VSMQPFQSRQVVILEKRKADGTLDFSEPQPPTVRRKCGHSEGPGVMTFEEVYKLYFREVPATVASGWSASWEELKAWLDGKGWCIRAKTW
jgi:hypothetical protein